MKRTLCIVFLTLLIIFTSGCFRRTQKEEPTADLPNTVATETGEEKTPASPVPSGPLTAASGEKEMAGTESTSTAVSLAPPSTQEEALSSPEPSSAGAEPTPDSSETAAPDADTSMGEHPSVPEPEENEGKLFVIP